MSSSVDFQVIFHERVIQLAFSHFPLELFMTNTRTPTLEHRYDIVTLKWVIKNWNLKREDFLLSSKGVMDHKTLDCAKYLQSKYNFNAYEALGNDLRVLGSWCGDARNLTFIQWYVRSSILIQCTQKQN